MRPFQERLAELPSQILFHLFNGTENKKLPENSNAVKAENYIIFSSKS